MVGIAASLPARQMLTKQAVQLLATLPSRVAIAACQVSTITEGQRIQGVRVRGKVTGRFGIGKSLPAITRSHMGEDGVPDAHRRLPFPRVVVTESGNHKRTQLDMVAAATAWLHECGRLIMMRQDPPLPPNDLLRAARLRLPSPSGSGRPMSRQELAEAVNAYLWEHYRQKENLSENDIGKLERGVTRWPGKRRREAFRAVLRAKADADLGFYVIRGMRSQSPNATTSGTRRGALDHPEPLGHWLRDPLEGGLSSFLAPVEPAPVPRKINRHDVAQVRRTASMFRGWDYANGGELAREAVFAHLRWCARLLHIDCPEALRRDLFAAVAELGAIAGFMDFDAHAHCDAKRAFLFGLKCSEESDDQPLRARLLSLLARQAIWCGRPDDGLTYVETALVQRDRLTATEQALLHTLRARALAKLCRPQEALAAVGASDEAFARSDPAGDPPWMSFYDDAQHHGDTGHALWDLYLNGQRTDAAARLAYAVEHHTAGYARSRAISRIKLASLTMAVGDPREASDIAHQALDDVDRLRSRRALDYLRELQHFSSRHAAIAEVAEVRERIAEALDAT